MILPSENAGGRENLPGVPERLLKCVVGRKNISRLEFHVHVIDKPGGEALQDVAKNSVLSVAETRLQEEMVVLEGQLSLQTQQIAMQLDLAKREAVTESRERWQEELEERVAVERAQVMRTCEEFAKERARYFAGVEAEVVKLALAIAARVLHREAKLDPLLLTAAVRVALEKVADNSTTILRVPVTEVERWQKVFMPELKAEVQLVEDERLGAGECVLETNVGRVELGVSAQLEEIEKGFFDLMQQRPA
ncbi:MAG: FliH/SctL family protein [Edaphobacter sp.]